MTTAAETSYDRVPYSALSFPHQSPARLGAVAALFGLQPSPPSKCRVLELGCGQGLSALNLAQLYPESEFVAVDLSSTHIANARRLQEKAGISNVRFEAASILDISPETHGAFDYITCHGVFSWVPQSVREKILQICGDQLTPNGVAFISFNAMPGWGPLKALREIFSYHAARYDDPLEKFEKCKALVGLLKDYHAPRPNTWTAQFFQTGAQMVQQAQASYFLHEYLEDENTPLYFHEFMAMAEPKGLQFISEFQVSQSLASALGPQFGNLVEFMRRSPVDGQQYIDFFRNTQFHMTLLCRDSVEVNRSLQSVNLGRFLFTSKPKAVQTVELAPTKSSKFQFAGGTNFTTNDPAFKTALVYMGTQPNVFLSIEEIARGAQSLLEKHGSALDEAGRGRLRNSVAQLISQLLGAGLVDFSLPDLGIYIATAVATEKPFAPALARAEAELGLPVLRTSLFSQPLRDEARAILPYCDGTRTQKELFEIYRKLVTERKVAAPAPARHDQAVNLGSAFGQLLRELFEGGIFWVQRNP